MILEINFKLEVNGMVIELHILYLHTYYHSNQHNIPECFAIIIDSQDNDFQLAEELLYGVINIHYGQET